MSVNTSIEKPAPIRGLRAGLAGWLVFAIALVALRGVRWDENYEFTQVLTGAVKYPVWHPLVFWVHHLYTGQLYLTAFLMEAFPGAFAANAVRNVFFVWATVLPPYLLGAALGRNALAGHVAAVLMLAGITIDFNASYPQFVLPGMFSNGHVGTGFALVAIAAFALRRPALAFFLIGLMPAVHIGQTPQLILFIGFLLLARWLRPQRKGAWRRADFALLGGLAASTAILAAGYFAWRDTALITPPATPARDVHAIWAGWVSYYDMHRRPPGILPILFTVVFILFAYLTLLGLGFAKDPAKFAWPITILYVGGALLIALSVMLVQILLGPQVPEFFLTWVPYRLWNHLPPILVAGLAAVLVPRFDREPWQAPAASTVCVAVALAFLAIGPTLRALAPIELASRYLSSTTPALFYLFGAVFTLLIPHVAGGRRPVRNAAAVIAITVLLVTAFYHQFGAVCAAAGAMTALFARRMVPAPGWLRYRSEIIGSLLFIIVAQIAIHEFVHREHLARGKFEGVAAAYLQEQGESKALLASPMGQVLLQAQTGHAVLADLATPFLIGYRTSMGPQINTMYTDLYGVDFRFPSPGRHWKQVWAERSPEEWRRLGATYGFRFVVAPEGVILSLDEAVAVNGRRLYRIR